MPSQHSPSDDAIEGKPSETTPMPRTARAVANLVRDLRRQQKLTLATLAERAEVSTGLLSQIERGLGNPSLSTLIKLADALGVGVGYFFVGETEKAGAHVKAGNNARLQLTEQGLTFDLLTPHMSGKLGMIRASVYPGWSNEESPYRHEGEECVFVLLGSLDVWLGGTHYHLDEGDSITYDSSIPHWYHNPGLTPTTVIGAMTPPTF